MDANLFTNSMGQKPSWHA